LIDLPTWRPLVMGRRGAVATNHPLASEAGVAVLRGGGNAADAYVAAASTLAVVEPHMSGLGGEGFALVYPADGGEAVVVNATGRAPLAATSERFAAGLPSRGPLAAMTPTLVDGWWEVHRRFGTLPWSGLFDSAIYHARSGFAATRAYCRFASEQATALAADPLCAATFLSQGRTPSLGAPIRQSALAATFEALAQGGRDAFYEGETARELCRWMQTRSGLIDAQDLSGCRAELQAPIRTTYRGLEVLEAPPSSTGCTLLEELNVAQLFDLAGLADDLALPSNGPGLIHTLVEIVKLCFLDREHVGDTADSAERVSWMLSSKRAEQLALLVDADRAVPRPVRWPASLGDTTYLAVADANGNVISGIQSLNDVFGACVIAGETGILLNNRMRYWHLEPGHPNRLAPGRRVRHTMNPPLVLKDGRPYLVFGTPGADAQVQANLQVLVSIVDFGLDPQQAVEAPRWQSFQPGADRNWPHEAPDRLIMEDRFPETTRAELARRGHNVVAVGPLDGPCSVNAIRRHGDFWQAASDPRRDGYAIAF
jgi:gamma-glutamyltranspeptidase/glutathione hydrolase